MHSQRKESGYPIIRDFASRLGFMSKIATPSRPRSSKLTSTLSKSIKLSIMFRNQVAMIPLAIIFFNSSRNPNMAIEHRNSYSKIHKEISKFYESAPYHYNFELDNSAWCRNVKRHLQIRRKENPNT